MRSWGCSSLRRGVAYTKCYKSNNDLDTLLLGLVLQLSVSQHQLVRSEKVIAVTTLCRSFYLNRRVSIVVVTDRILYLGSEKDEAVKQVMKVEEVPITVVGCYPQGHKLRLRKWCLLM